MEMLTSEKERAAYTMWVPRLHGISQHHGEQAIWNFLFNIFGYSSETAGSESVSREGYCNLFGRPQETNTGEREFRSNGAKQ